MKLLLDMNLPPRLADVLTENGIQAVHWFYIGAPNAPDTELITYAHDNEYIIVSADLDFCTILSATHSNKPSIVQIRFSGMQIEFTAKLIISALRQYETEMENGAIMTVNVKKTRVRLLPV